MKRKLCLVLLLLLPLLVMGPSASADKPTMERFPVDDVFVDESCGFPVEVHIVGTVVHIEWTDEAGHVRFLEAYPGYRLILTNLDTGETITATISGPAHFTAEPDGSFTLIGTGIWGWFFNPATGEQGLFLTKGRFVTAVDAEGNESFSIVGEIVNLCPELAA